MAARQSDRVRAICETVNKRATELKQQLQRFSQQAMANHVQLVKHIQERSQTEPFAPLPFDLPANMLPAGSDPALVQAHARIRALETLVGKLKAELTDAKTERT